MSKVVNLALQGGGSHGAFTWGVLDRLLEDERLSFEGISATSAGAVNAVVLADGLAAGGRVGARDALRVYWQKVSALSARGIFKPSLVDKGNSDFGIEHSLGFWFLKMTYLTSPYQIKSAQPLPRAQAFSQHPRIELSCPNSRQRLPCCCSGSRSASRAGRAVRRAAVKNVGRDPASGCTQRGTRVIGDPLRRRRKLFVDHVSKNRNRSDGWP